MQRPLLWEGASLPCDTMLLWVALKCVGDGYVFFSLCIFVLRSDGSFEKLLERRKKLSFAR